MTKRNRLIATSWALIFGFLLLFATAGASVFLTSQREQAALAVKRTLRASDQLNRVMNLLTDAETGQRGYLLTGRLDYLEPYETAQRSLPEALLQLGAALSDGNKEANLIVLQSLINEKMSELKSTINLRAAGRMDDALAVVNNDHGSRYMSQIRNLIAGLAAAESEQFETRSRRATSLAATIRDLLVGSSILVLATGALTLIETRSRMRTLAKLNEDLQQEAQSRAAAEMQARQMQKMEAVGQLTGGIAHDFNNMLAIVIGSLDLAVRRMEGLDAPKVRKSIADAVEGANRAALLTARLLAFARQQPLEPSILDANKLVGGISELLRHTLGERIQIETVLAGGLWRTFVDAAQLESAVVNLAVNGRDAMPDGGKLTIETGNADLDERYAAAHEEVSAGQYVLLSLSDTGVGMPPEVMRRAVDPFYSTKGPGKGTGLGLSQVFGFVKQSGGHLKIYSEIDRGTTIKIYLPRHFGPEPEVHAAKASADLPVGTTSEIILVVEDEDQVRGMTVDALRELGYTVVHAANGRDALQLLANQPEIAMLFSDIVMPEMTGRELYDTARLEWPQLKVLYTTGYTRNAIVHNGIVDPGTAFIAKPFTIHQLAAKVREVLDR